MSWLAAAVPLIDRTLGWLQTLGHLLDLVIRLYVANVFFKSGLLKIGNWDGTLYLFSNEYRVPLLAPDAAAVLGTSASSPSRRSSRSDSPRGSARWASRW